VINGDVRILNITSVDAQNLDKSLFVCLSVCLMFNVPSAQYGY
jgi:hypothetical protein